MSDAPVRSGAADPSARSNAPTASPSAPTASTTDPADDAAPATSARGRGVGRTDAGALLVSAVVAAVVGGGLWVASRNSAAAVVVVVTVLQGALVLSVMTGLRVPGRIGGTVITVLAAAAADVLAVEFPADQLGVLVPPLGLLVLAIFVAQLSRGVMRVRVVESISDIAVVGIAVIALSSLVVLQHRVLDPGAAAPTAAVPVVLVVGAALLLGALGDLVAPVPRFDPTVQRGLLGVLLAGVAGGVAAWSVLHDAFGFGPQRGAFLGAALGVVVGLIAVGSSFLQHEPAPATPAQAGPADDDDGDRRTLDVLAAEEVLVEVDAQATPSSAWPGRLQPVAATLWAFALACPVGYLLTVALGG